MNDKEQFWKAMAGDFVQHCGNCIHSGGDYSVCDLEFFHKIQRGRTICQCHGVNPFIYGKELASANNPHWEWDGENE